MALEVPAMGWNIKYFVRDPNEAQLRFFWSLMCVQTGYVGGDECFLGRDNTGTRGIEKKKHTWGVSSRCPPTLASVEGPDRLTGAPVWLLVPPEGVLTCIIPH